MKLKILVEKEVEITTLSVSAGVRWWCDAVVNNVQDRDGDLIPCRVDDRWCLEIDIGTGVIRNWRQGTTAEVYYKVCDDGIYELKDADNNIICSRDGYVPEIMCPKIEGYGGDYIAMDIDENGRIKDWQPDIKDFMDDE